MKTQVREVLPDQPRAALDHLWKAFTYARDVEMDPWEFAVRLAHLVELGVDESDLRWLVLNGYVHHAEELTTLRDRARRFRPSANLAFTADTCFVLSDAGVLAVGETADLPLGGSALFPRIVSSCSPLPHWDSDRRVLYFDGEVVKQFRFHAENQMTVLAAFEGENWPFTIDDPLAPQSGAPPKQLLCDTIRSLNANHCRPLLRFHVDGSGEHIGWEPYHARVFARGGHRRAA